jgi:glycosyltransferase involved in cell wall biosynthesis
VARVLLLCNDVIGENMAGPAIRYWELARHLADRHEVTLACAARPTLVGEGFETVGLIDRPLRTLMPEADVCVTQLVWPSVGLLARKHGVRIVLDCYDPILLEELEAHAAAPLRNRRVRNTRTLAKTRMSLAAADAVVCANERQRDLWLGALMALDRLTPAEYAADPSLRRLVNLVPFGLPDGEPVRNGPGLRTSLGLSPEDVLLLWGGGIWNWFDPLTLIRAVHSLLPAHPRLHLAFLGVRHPNQHVPEAQMAQRAVALAEELGVLGTHVHVNYGWTPYDERQNHLLDADIGVSTHFEQLETRFSFRTRMLDYLWAGLPIVATEGDSFAELIEHHELGRVVPPEDVRALAGALADLVDDPAERARIRARVGEAAREFRWSAVAGALDDTIGMVMSREARRGFPPRELRRYVGATAREVVVERRQREAFARLRDRVVRHLRR